MKNTIKKIYEEAKQNAYKKDTSKITITMGDLGILLNYAEGIGVRDICDKHLLLSHTARQKAAKLRYHIMAESILPSSDIIYDSRYADVSELWDWEI